ncbi:DUF2007 domain-containing protein [Reinekea marinisedimentorum]|uniref:Putative signal transducing protein n=1 Tax=Reinekea marinisedimentorum TaxID=230495 RepID=A0A4R3ICB2_9GAMM|nr:DUF2007 domain-containing protein [Reinekea marinisedimentorum]TCS43303.1 putative signal transducing protein [Reinekea marinisedimentorum]
MKLIYEAANSIEAHLILNLLEQSHLSARIDGEYLQGGVGDLQAIGIVRVMVDEADYDAAKEIVDHWDASQPEPDATNQISAPGYPLLLPGVIGFVLGVIVTLLLIA